MFSGMLRGDKMKKIFDEVPHLVGENITIKRITQQDAAALSEMVNDKDVYRYLPTFLFEQKYDDINYVIKQMYDECFANKESVFMGIYQNGGGEFCGIAEFYGFKDDIHKVSIGYRLLKKYWGKGIVSQTVSLLIDYLDDQTDIEIIAASSMPGNRASAKVLEKSGFSLVARDSREVWGLDTTEKVDKWIR